MKFIFRLGSAHFRRMLKMFKKLYNLQFFKRLRSIKIVPFHEITFQLPIVDYLIWKRGSLVSWKTLDNQIIELRL